MNTHCEYILLFKKKVTEIHTNEVDSRVNGESGYAKKSNLIRGFDTSPHVLLNLLNKLRKIDKMKACPVFYRFFPMSFINSIIQEHKC